MGRAAWHGVYTGVDRPVWLGADEWFGMGGGGREGPPTAETLTFDSEGNGFTKRNMPEPEAPKPS